MDLMRSASLALISFYLFHLCFNVCVLSMTWPEKKIQREKIKEMFMHGYLNYMNKAYPADELMPISCRGRYRGLEPSRGDIDEALGNFSLTLIDSLDTLPVLGEFEEFDRAVRLVVDEVTFDSDIVVSTFETNIRVLGGLLGGHVMAKVLQKKKLAVEWYHDELLSKALDLGYRLLPAFNTTTGIPYPKINLLHGVSGPHARTGHEQETCTACAGTMLLEFAALSRLSGQPVFEEKAHKAMEALWRYRNRGSDLVGTVINLHSGDWVRRESGVGAGIDSYYEYVFKAYILLGDDSYLTRFNKHYAAIRKYINQGPMMLDVHMHQPMTNSRNFMDALLAFWPGLQILKGDIKEAVETHEMLYQVVRRHHFIPEAFTPDFRVHWPQHPLRPEFVESTYLIYKATGDPYYLEVGKKIIENLNKYARVPCGFAALKDVTAKTHEDQMDSFVLAETFKYLYLLFSEDGDLVFNIDDYIFTTEAHLLPLTLSVSNNSAQTLAEDLGYDMEAEDDDDLNFERSCMNIQHLYKNSKHFLQSLRSPVQVMQSPTVCSQPTQPGPAPSRTPRVRAAEFSVTNVEHMEQLKRMGIRTMTMNDGRVQLVHAFNLAESKEAAEEGVQFMQEMIELSKTVQSDAPSEPRVIQFMSEPFVGSTVLQAGPAQFGWDFAKHGGVRGQLAEASPLLACQPLTDDAVKGKIGVTERGGCMFVDKARHLEAAGALGMIVIDNQPGTTVSTSPVFAMSGDDKQDVNIPVVFLFNKEGQQLLTAMRTHAQLEVFIGASIKSLVDVLAENQALETDAPLVDSSVPDPACPAVEVIRMMRLAAQAEDASTVTNSAEETQPIGALLGKYTSFMAAGGSADAAAKATSSDTIIATAQINLNGQTFPLTQVLPPGSAGSLTEEAVRSAIIEAVRSSLGNVLAAAPGIASVTITDGKAEETSVVVDPAMFVDSKTVHDPTATEKNSIDSSSPGIQSADAGSNGQYADELSKLMETIMDESQSLSDRQDARNNLASLLANNLKSAIVVGPLAEATTNQQDFHVVNSDDSKETNDVLVPNVADTNAEVSFTLEASYTAVSSDDTDVESSNMESDHLQHGAANNQPEDERHTDHEHIADIVEI